MRKSRCIDSQRQAIVDSPLKHNETMEAICGNGKKPITLADHTALLHESNGHSYPVKFTPLSGCFSGF